MLTRENFSESHIQDVRAESKRDPGLLEQSIYAFGLLEAIVRVGMPFIFKGGTCLMLLLDHPMRLSTDIDIIVEPGTEIEKYIEEASKIFPFRDCEEQKRVGKNNIEKRHFKFTYQSPLTQRSIYILLDVLFEKNEYAKLVEKPIHNELLLTEEPYLTVRIPSVNSILGDKLAAFAPHTTGIPLGAGKDMEVMKQMYDVATLIDAFDDFEEVRRTYWAVSEAEIAYRGAEITPEDSLYDTLRAAASIATRGKLWKEDYTVYLKGIRDVQGHIYSESFTAENAALKAPKIMYMVACLIKDVPFERVVDGTSFEQEKFENAGLKSLKFMRKHDSIAYAYTIKADRLIGAEFSYGV